MTDHNPPCKTTPEVQATSAFSNRKTLPHAVPSWVEPGSLYFITLCGAPRGLNQFCHRDTDIAARIFDTIAHRHLREDWHVRLALLMPDHVHMLVTFPRTVAMKATITQWKAYLARNFSIHWQRDFFEHRLRRDESLQEKAHYIRMNPTRAGLSSSPEAWPYVWEPERLLGS